MILPDVYLELATDAGVFSPGRLDPGTRLLLEEAPAPPARGDVLDLGCGYGPVACVLAARSPGAAVWAVDVNERALELCARNARTAGLANVRCLPPGDTLAAGPVRRDLVQPAGPHRQGGTARAAVRLAGPAGAGRPRLPGGRAQPGRRLAAPLAGRTGLAGDPAGRTERLPPAPGGLSGRTGRGEQPVSPPGPVRGGRPPAAAPHRGQAAQPGVAPGQRHAPGHAARLGGPAVQRGLDRPLGRRVRRGAPVAVRQHGPARPSGRGQDRARHPAAGRGHGGAEPGRRGQGRGQRRPAGGRGRTGRRRGPAARGAAGRRRVPGRRQRGPRLHGGAARGGRRGHLYPPAGPGRVAERRGGGGRRDGGGPPPGAGRPPRRHPADIRGSPGQRRERAY